MCVLASSPLLAQPWAHKMFSEKHHDFGTVSRNAKAEHVFQFENSFEEELHVASVRSSCGCTKPSIAKNRIAPHSTGEILALLNTKSFIGQKNAVITVVFDRPYYAEVQLTVSGHIRSDIVTDPGEVRFGELELGESKEIVVRVSYAGRPDWKITDVRGSSEHLEVRMDPTTRQGNVVTVPLRVRLKDTAPAGELLDELTVVTNDSRSGQFSLPLSATIRSPLTITPHLVSLGAVRKGSSTKQKLLVRSKKPFEITEVVCEDPRFQFEIPSGAKAVQVVPFEFIGDDLPGEFRQKVVVKTNVGEEFTAECVVTGSLIQ